MARRHVGTLPLGGTIALCAILLFAPEARSQIKVTRKMLTISGSVGLAQVTLQGLPGAEPGQTVQTDENGVYSAQVVYGWTGKVQPVKTGYVFQPPEIAYSTKVTSDLAGQNYVATRLKFTISGSVGLPGVKMNGLPDVISDEKGRYTATVDYGWSGNATPEKAGYRFDPTTRSYTDVTRNVVDNYQQSPMTYTISGTAERPGIVMKGLPGEPTTGSDGTYRVEVPYEWSGTVTPTREGCLFRPEKREYVMVTSPQTNQDFNTEVLSYIVSGSVGMDGVVLKGFPEDVVSDPSGFYMVSVEHGWGGTITPEKPGYTFAPPSKEYKKVTETQENENYNASVVYLKIEGTTGVGEATLSGFPGGAVTTDAKGFYSAQVEYNWTGTVIPDKPGYSFTPKERTYPGVTTNQVDQNYKGEKVYFEISGNVGLPNVQLKGFPTSVVSKTDGSYSAKVDYNWSGTVTPVKAGYEFEPEKQEYASVFMPQLNQDYLARTIQHRISGKVLTKSGEPVPGVAIVGEGTSPVAQAMTDQDGSFEIKVDHNWRGKITPQAAGWIFSPVAKPFEAVTGPIPNQSIVGEVKMLTLSNVIMFADKEPIQGIQVSAEPNDNTVSSVTDATGRYNVKVPYGWSGTLHFHRDDLDFSENDPVTYADVTEDIDETARKRTTQPPVDTGRQAPPVDTGRQAPPVDTGRQAPRVDAGRQTPPVDAGRQAPPVDTGRQAPPVDQSLAGRDVILRRLAQVQSEYDTLKTLPFNDTNRAKMLDLLQEQVRLEQMLETGGTLDTQTVEPQPSEGGKPAPGDTLAPKLHSVLGELGRRTNTKIYADMTVKDDPCPVGVESVTGMSVEQALQQILDSMKRNYTFRVLPDNTYEVYYPISNMYPFGTEITSALGDIATEVAVPIICDPNVSLTTTASFENVPLETALDMILAGTPYSFRRMTNYYLVGDSGPKSLSFQRLTETRYLRLSHITPTRAKDLLAEQHKQYVQAEAASTIDPNDQGHLLTVTAPTEIADKIIELVKKYDVSRRQVLLDTRVVAMDHGNLLNLGVKWDFPAFEYGQLLTAHDWTKALSIGYSLDGTFTNALMAKINALQTNNQLEIVANPQLTAQDGSQAELRSIQEEWFMMTDTSTTSLYSRSELQKIESGTILTITPYIGDSNEITLEMAVEVSDSIAKGADSDLPIINRRQAKNKVTVQNGGTVAVAGLTENRTRKIGDRVPVLGSIPLVGRLFRNDDNQKTTREIAVFVTANLVPEKSSEQVIQAGIGGPGALGAGVQPRPAGQEFKNGLAEALASQR